MRVLLKMTNAMVMSEWVKKIYGQSLLKAFEYKILYGKQHQISKVKETASRRKMLRF